MEWHSYDYANLIHDALKQIHPLLSWLVIIITFRQQLVAAGNDKLFPNSPF